MAAHGIRLAQRGQVTIPKTLREKHKWDTGQQFSILDLNGVVIMSPKASKVDALANELRDALLHNGVALDDILAEIRKTGKKGS